jgi:DNA-binding transcriptional MocR family regulator
LIIPRPQSGFYVKPAWRPALPEPPQTKPAAAPRKVSVATLVMQLLKAGGDPRVIPLGSADPADHCLPTQKLNRIQASLARRIRNGINAYDHPPGLLELRQQVGRIMMDAGCQLHPEDLITTCGCQEAIQLCLRAVAKPGDVIAIESPTYYGHLQIIESLGMRALELPTSPRTGIDLDALEDAMDSRGACRKKSGCRPAAVLLVPSFNNPLGFEMPAANKQRLVKMLSSRGVPLIEDDVYGDLGFPAAPIAANDEPLAASAPRPHACKAWDRDGNVLLCSSFSKTLTPGSRVGWCAPGRYAEKVQLLKVATTLGTPTLAQRTLAEFLATGGYERHIRRIRRVYAEQVRRYTDAIAHYFPSGTCIARPAGGFVLWVKLPGGADAEALAARAMEHKITVAPGPIFSASNRFRDCIRITCAPAWSERIDQALRKLGQLAAASPR